MKQAISFTSVALSGVLGGYLVMRAMSPASEAASVSPATPAKAAGATPVPPQAADAIADRSAGPAKHDLVSLLKWNRQRQSSGTPTVREMERLDKGELRALIMDMAGDPQADPQVQSITARAAAKELFKREGDAAFDWVAGLDDALRKAVYPRVLQAALEADPIAYKSKLDDFKTENGGQAASSFYYPMIGGATERGAEDLIKLQEAYGDDLKHYMFPMGTLPEDFDFHRFFTGLPPSAKDGMRNTFKYWAAKDREAAWVGYKDVTGGGGPGAGAYFPALFDGAAAVAGPSKAAEWLAPKLAELPGERRTKALDSLGASGSLDSETITILIPLLGTDADRMQLAQRAVAGSTNGSRTGVAALAALSSDEQRTEVLLNHVRTYGFDKMPSASRTRLTGALESLMEEAKLPVAMRAQVTDELKAQGGAGK